MTEQEKAILAAIVASGITAEALGALLSKAATLTLVESKSAELERKRAEAAAAAAAYEVEMQALQAELAELRAQAVISL